MLYERIISDLEEKVIYYNAKEADKAITWIETHTFHTEGALAPAPLKLEIWQKALVAAIFGLYETDTKKRVAREILLVVARKNGKRAVCSWILSASATAPKPLWMSLK